MTKKIKLFDVSIDDKEKNILEKIIESKFWASGSGTEFVKKFEKQFQKYIKSKSCIAVNSGTDALHLALSQFDIKNKEVILPSLSFVSTANSVLYNEGIPIFADIDPKTLCLDPKDVKKKISKKTKAIIPVHFAGMPANLVSLKKIAKDNKLAIIEDAAHSAGSSYKGKMIGSHSDACCFSFHPVKNLAMPSGGLVSLNHKNHKLFASEINAKRWCGITNRKSTEYDVKDIGWNYYMNEFSAGIGLVQLSKLTKLNNIRKKTAKKFSSKLHITTKMNYDKNCSYHFYWILVKNRNHLRKKLFEHGIETGTHYKPIHKFSLYSKKSQKLPVTEYVKDKIVSLPCHPNLSTADIDKIVKLVNKYAE